MLSWCFYLFEIATCLWRYIWCVQWIKHVCSPVTTKHNRDHWDLKILSSHVNLHAARSNCSFRLLDGKSIVPFSIKTYGYSSGEKKRVLTTVHVNVANSNPTNYIFLRLAIYRETPKIKNRAEKPTSTAFNVCVKQFIKLCCQLFCLVTIECLYFCNYPVLWWSHDAVHGLKHVFADLQSLHKKNSVAGFWIPYA